MTTLAAQVAMVTGGATGIGVAIVERLAKMDAQVACCYHKSRQAAEVLAARLQARGKEVFPVKINVADSQEVQAGIEAIVGHFGRPISILVNNAGDIVDTAPIDQMDEALWDMVIDINLKGAFLCAKYCLPAMKAAQRGRIINISSISARSGGALGAAHYAASKGGLEAFTRALAKEAGPYHITVNAIAPGVVYTAIHERFNTPEKLEELRQTVPLTRLGVPEDVAGVVAFLVSEDATYITGEVIAVNGGMRMN